MKILINERLSEHRCKTPEGYLICTDAILARTGKQTYRKNEIFKDSDDETEIEVDRTEDEVFSPQTLASFENKPVTVEHPDEDVNVHNYKEYAVGFVRDVRRGEANGQPVILGNLVITDEKTIQEIENGEHTDLSCGYDCDIADEANPCQRNIRGNHVALCECGRAGIARIVDSDVPRGYKVTGNNYAWELSGTAKDKTEAANKFTRKYPELENIWGISELLNFMIRSNKDVERDTELGYALHFDYDEDTKKFYIAFVEKKYRYDDSIKDAASIVKGIIYSTNHEIAEGTFGNEIVEKIGKNIYVTYWTDGTMHNSHTSSDMIDPVFWATSYNGAELDMYDFNRLGKYINAKPKLVKIAKEYLNDSVKDKQSVFAKGFRELDSRAKVANLMHGYAIIPASKWRKFGLNAEVERFTTNLDEARYIRSSLERNDGISFVIVDVTQRRTTDSMKDAEQTFRVLAVVPGDYDDEPGFDIIFNVKANSENEAIAKAKKYAEKTPAYRFAWDFRIAKPNQHTRIERNVDSMKDALIPPTKEAINKFESLLRISDVEIERKGLTTFGRVHYQVRAFMPFDQFVKILHRIDDVMDKLGIPMTFNAGADGDGDVCTAGIDLDKQHVKDSAKAQKIQKIVKVAKSIK